MISSSERILFKKPLLKSPLLTRYYIYLIGGINKPLSCLYQHEPQPGQLTNYVLEILLFMEKNLLEPLYISGVYLSLPRVFKGGESTNIAA
jgi:hypothetical protein